MTLSDNITRPLWKPNAHYVNSPTRYPNHPSAPQLQHIRPFGTNTRTLVEINAPEKHQCDKHERRRGWIIHRTLHPGTWSLSAAHRNHRYSN